MSASSTSSSSSCSGKNVQPQENHMEKFIPAADNDENENSKEVLEKNNSDEEMEQEEEQGIDHNNNGALVLVEQEEEKEQKDDDVKSSRILWSREDEVRLLNILVHFKKKNGHVSGSHVYLYVNKKFKNTFTVQQIGYKVKRIRRKHKLYKRKVGTDGSVNILDSYQKKIYNLCELIWNKNGVKSDEVKLMFDLDCYIDDITKDCNDQLMDKKILRKGFDILESSKKEKLKEKSGEFPKAELELTLKRSALLSEHLRLVREAFNSSA